MTVIPFPRAGNIGQPIRRIEFEPMPQEAPAQEPATPEREAVPA